MHFTMKQMVTNSYMAQNNKKVDDHVFKVLGRMILELIASPNKGARGLNAHSHAISQEYALIVVSN